MIRRMLPTLNNDWPIYAGGGAVGMLSVGSAVILGALPWWTLPLAALAGSVVVPAIVAALFLLWWNWVR